VDASTRVALAGVVVSLVIGFATWLLNRRAQAQQHDLGLIDQIQEERTHAQQRARESDSDLDACRNKLTEAYEQIDTLLSTTREQARRIADLESRQSPGA
jgi:ribosomal protein L9